MGNKEKNVLFYYEMTGKRMYIYILLLIRVKEIVEEKPVDYYCEIVLNVFFVISYYLLK